MSKHFHLSHLRYFKNPQGRDNRPDCYSLQPINAQILRTEILYHLSFNRHEETATQRGKWSGLKQPRKQPAKAGNEFNTLKLHIECEQSATLREY